MTAKKINELSAKTPVGTDLIPVADPTTGIAGKSTNSQFYNATIRSLSVAYTGNAPPDIAGMISPACAVQAGSSLSFSDGVTIEQFSYISSSSKSPTTITFNNLTMGRLGASIPPGWALLTSISFPSLIASGASFSINTPTITSISVPVLTYVGNVLQVNGLTSLTTLSFPSLYYVSGNVSVNTLTSCTSLSYPALVYVGGNFSPGTMGSLTTLSVPLLAYVGSSLNPTLNGPLATFSFPSLTFIGVSLSPTAMASLTTFSFPVLEFVGSNFAPNTMASLTTISFPALKSIGVNLARTTFNSGQISPSTMASLTSLTFPAIEVIGSSSSVSINIVSGTAALSTFTLGSTLQRVEGNVIMTSCALDQTSVDGLLVRLAALDGTGLTTAYSSKTVTITGTSATPSATGLAAKSTLVSRGCTVTNN